MKRFHDKVVEMLNTVYLEENDNIENTCKQIVERITRGGTFYVMETGHSHTISKELFAQAGGLANIQMIASSDFALCEHAGKTTYAERIAEYANAIVKRFQFTEKDAIMLCSHSGRNQMPIELALRCREKGTLTIALTNCSSLQYMASGHHSDKRLFDVCHLSINNYGEAGDAMTELSGIKGKKSAASSIINVYISQLINQYIITKMNEKNIEVPAHFHSNMRKSS